MEACTWSKALEKVEKVFESRNNQRPPSKTIHGDRHPLSALSSDEQYVDDICIVKKQMQKMARCNKVVSPENLNVEKAPGQSNVFKTIELDMINIISENGL